MAKRSNKRLKDLEYNVYGTSAEKREGNPLSSNSGCLTVIAGIAITAAVCIFILLSLQMGRNGAALTCATTGCSNRVRGGSTYCWLHGPQSTKTRKSNTQADPAAPKKNTETTPEPEQKERRKIFSGVGEANNNSSRVNGSIVQ